MAAKNAFKPNWQQASIDILLIVVGVSIALAADSWLGERTERARTDQLLDALEHEWTLELDRINVHLEVLNDGKLAIIQLIKAHDIGTEELSIEAAESLMDAYKWSTFKASDGALSTIMVDGVQNIEDEGLRLAIASWRTVLDELTAEQAALRELGTLGHRSIGARIAHESGEEISGDMTEIDYWAYGMASGTFAHAAISDDEWITTQRHVLNLLNAYQTQLTEVRNVLSQNLALLRDRN